MKNIGYRCSSRKEDPEERLGRLAARQWGVFGRQQVLEAGLPVQALDRRLQSGAWQRVHPRVYRMRGAPVSWQQRLMAAQLWAGESAAISHRAAGALWELDGFEPGIVELTVLGRRCPAPAGIILHHTRELGRSDAGLLGPLRVTGIARTLMDLGAVVEDPALVEAALESALRRDPELLDRLIDRLDAFGGRGRRGAGVAREILALRDPRSAPTES